jgi:hypothetical protein
VQVMLKQLLFQLALLQCFDFIWPLFENLLSYYLIILSGVAPKLIASGTHNGAVDYVVMEHFSGDNMAVIRSVCSIIITHYYYLNNMWKLLFII